MRPAEHGPHSHPREGPPEPPPNRPAQDPGRTRVQEAAWGPTGPLRHTRHLSPQTGGRDGSGSRTRTRSTPPQRRVTSGVDRQGPVTDSRRGRGSGPRVGPGRPLPPTHRSTPAPPIEASPVDDGRHRRPRPQDEDRKVLRVRPEPPRSPPPTSRLSSGPGTEG